MAGPNRSGKLAKEGMTIRTTTSTNGGPDMIEFPMEGSMAAKPDWNQKKMNGSKGYSPGFLKHTITGKC